MKRLKQLHSFLKRGKLAEKRPVYKSGETWNFMKWGCPGCGKHKFFEGPSGGACINICCSNQACQKAFNIGPGFVESISNHAFLSLFGPEQEKFGRWQTD